MDSLSIPLANTTWEPISTTYEDIFIKDKGYYRYPRRDVVFCHVQDNGTFSMWDREGTEYRYDPLAPRTYNFGTCSTGNTDLGEWSRYDMKGYVRFQYHDTLIVQPESVTEDVAWVLEISRGNSAISYYPYQPSEHLRILTWSDSSVSVANAGYFIQSVVYGDGHVYAILREDEDEDTVSQELIRGEARYWKLACFPFKPSSEPVPSEAVVIPWIVKCDQDQYNKLRLFSASAKGKFYFFCPITNGTDDSTVINLYTFNSDSKLSQGPRRIQATLDNPGSNVNYMDLVSGSAQDAEPAYAILTISGTRRLVIDLRGDYDSLPNWEEYRQPVEVASVPELEPECRTKGSTTKLIVSCTLSALFVASFLAFWYVRWRSRRHKDKDIKHVQPSRRTLQKIEHKIGSDMSGQTKVDKLL
ncbi:hypothetical protein BGZ94_007346 [Podila epigama]|nr:hypothetical protein BGZ94_007346 [Podila epigama]